MDYRVSFDQSTGVYVELASGVTLTRLTATTLTEGKTYRFKVEARNSFGYSEESQAIAILCATVPSTPLAPSNYVDGSNVIIKWTKPKINGLEITSYTVTIQTSTGSFSTELAYCDGSKPEVVAAT